MTGNKRTCFSCIIFSIDHVSLLTIVYLFSSELCQQGPVFLIVCLNYNMSKPYCALKETKPPV